MKYLGVVLLVLSGYVMAEEVYYCADYNQRSVGFKANNKTRQYLETDFYETKFQMKLQSDGNISIKIINQPNRRDLYICSFTSDGHNGKAGKSCVSKTNNGNYLNFNLSNSRYVLLNGSGYVFNEHDSVSVNIGSCTLIPV